MGWKRLGIVAVVIVLTAHCGSSGSDRHDALPPPPPDASDPCMPFTIFGVTFENDAGPPEAVVYLTSSTSIHLRVDAVRVTAGGSLTNVRDTNADGPAGQTLIYIALDGSGTQMTFEVDLGCGAAEITKHYSFSPTGNGNFVLTEG